MYRKTLGKQTAYRSPKGNEKQIDYILTKTRYLKYNKDAEANDMIHMGSDHRCVMATFMITTPERSSQCKTKRKNSTPQSMKGGIKPRKNIGVGKHELKKKYREIIEKCKKKTTQKSSSVSKK